MTLLLLAASTSAKSSGSGIVGLLPIVLLGVVGFIFLQRNNRRKQAAAAEVSGSVAVGEQVMTTAGLFARVRALEEGGDIVLLEIAPGVVCRYAKGAIARVIVPEEPELYVPDDLADEDLGGHQPEVEAPETPKKDDRGDTTA